MIEAELDDQAKMRRFWHKGEPPAIGNAEQVAFELASEGWRHRASPANMEAA